VFRALCELTARTNHPTGLWHGSWASNLLQSFLLWSKAGDKKANNNPLELPLPTASLRKAGPLKMPHKYH